MPSEGDQAKGHTNTWEVDGFRIYCIRFQYFIFQFVTKSYHSLCTGEARSPSARVLVPLSIPHFIHFSGFSAQNWRITGSSLAAFSHYPQCLTRKDGTTYVRTYVRPSVRGNFHSPARHFHVQHHLHIPELNTYYSTSPGRFT